MAIDLNDLAVQITEAEGGKQNLDIGQVKEVMRLVFERLAQMSLKDLGEILERYR